jgi:glucokinase
MDRCGIDVGGTKCLGVVLDATGTIVAERRRPTPHGAEALLTTIVELADDLRSAAASGPCTLGVGVPGLVTRNGLLRAAPNLIDTFELPVADELGRRLGMRVPVDNDNTCATEAEWRLGAAQGSDDVVFVGLGTGIGGGAVLGGVLQRGHHGFAGEAGHMVVDPTRAPVRLRPARVLGAVRLGQRPVPPGP